MCVCVYPDVYYHASWEELEKTTEYIKPEEIDNYLTDVNKLGKHIDTIESLYGSIEVWSAMTQKQRADVVDKVHLKSFLVAGLIAVAGIVTFTIPVRKKIKKNETKGT